MGDMARALWLCQGKDGRRLGAASVADPAMADAVPFDEFGRRRRDHRIGAMRAIKTGGSDKRLRGNAGVGCLEPHDVPRFIAGAASLALSPCMQPYGPFVAAARPANDGLMKFFNGGNGVCSLRVVAPAQ